MSKFTNAGLVEQIVWDMRLADLPRGENRALIDRLANGLAPYTKKEQEAGRLKTNVNFLEFPELLADARRSYYTAFLKSANFFNVTLDYGPPVKRKAWGRIITRELNRVMKASPKYFELLRSQFAMTVEHGIGPAVWPDRDRWCPQAVGIEDVMIPSGTLLSMDNLAYFAVYKEMTAMELYKATHGHKVDPAWKMDVVDAAIAWADEQVRAQVGYSDLYAPQKVEERWKQDLGWYASDAVPTVNCWDFYFWSDMEKQAGWRRRMIIDTPCAYEIGGRRKLPPRGTKMPPKNLIGQDHGKWLYNPGDNRVYADKLGEIIHFQFGDASAVAPFHYHSVRALGWLLFAPCHLQNRFQCRLNDAGFEALMQYFRTTNEEDKERILKVELVNLGVVPQGVSFVKPEERWKIDYQLAGLILSRNQERMQKAAAQYREGRDEATARKEKTATEIMSEVNAANALVGALMLQAYQYYEFQGLEICRRFTRRKSEDAGVRQFRVACLRAGVPEKYLDSSIWTVAAERVLGSGNKTLQIAMADKLMAVRGQLNPSAQQEVDYQYVLANSDDPDLANRLVPLEDKEMSNTPHDSAISFTALLQGIPVPPRRGESQIEVIETWLTSFGKRLAFLKAKGLPTMEDLLGLQNVGANIGARIEMLAQDKGNASRAKGYGKALAKGMKIVQTMMKVVQKMAQQAGEGGNGAAQEEAAMARVKLQGAQALTAVKLQGKQLSDRQRLQQKDAQFRQRQQQEREKHQSDLGRKAIDAHTDVAIKSVQTAADIDNNRLRALSEPKGENASD